MDFTFRIGKIFLDKTLNKIKKIYGTFKLFKFYRLLLYFDYIKIELDNLISKLIKTIYDFKNSSELSQYVAFDLEQINETKYLRNLTANSFKRFDTERFVVTIIVVAVVLVMLSVIFSDSVVELVDLFESKLKLLFLFLESFKFALFDSLTNRGRDKIPQSIVLSPVIKASS